MAVVLGRFDAWDEKNTNKGSNGSNGSNGGNDVPDLLIIAHNVSERTLEWRTAHDHKVGLYTYTDTQEEERSTQHPFVIVIMVTIPSLPSTTAQHHHSCASLAQ